MREIYEYERIRKQMRPTRKIGSYEREAINDLLTQNLITDDESDFLLSHMSL